MRLTLMSGGFPCQDVSIAGNGVGLSGERSGLVWEFLRLAGELYPDYLLIENVPAIRTRGLWQILQKLAEIGYDAEWHTYPASAFGASQIRERTFIIAYTPGKRISGPLAWDYISKAGSGGRVARRICSLYCPDLNEVVSLNPFFAEALMGFPRGWTELNVSGMRSSRNKSTRSLKPSQTLKEESK